MRLNNGQKFDTGICQRLLIRLLGNLPIKSLTPTSGHIKRLLISQKLNNVAGTVQNSDTMLAFFEMGFHPGA
jgi:hypothetical protein